MIAARVPRQVGQLAPSVLAIFLIITPVLAADDSNKAWAALVKGGHVAVIRHVLAHDTSISLWTIAWKPCCWPGPYRAEVSAKKYRL